MSDSLTSAHSHSDSSTAGQHQDDTTTDDDYNDRPSSSLLTPAPSGRRRSEATSPALSPIVEESPAHQHGQRRTGADVLDKDNGMHTASLGMYPPIIWVYLPYFPDYRSHSIICRTPNSGRQSLCFKNCRRLDQETPACDSWYICCVCMCMSDCQFNKISKVSRTPLFGCGVLCKKVRLVIREIRYLALL